MKIINYLSLFSSQRVGEHIEIKLKKYDRKWNIIEYTENVTILSMNLCLHDNQMNFFRLSNGMLLGDIDNMNANGILGYKIDIYTNEDICN